MMGKRVLKGNRNTVKTDGTEETMGRRYPECPVPAVGAVVLKGRDVLLIVRGQEPGYGQWSVPGGAILLGETLDQALIREIDEEVGILVEPVGLIEAVDRIVYDKRGDVLYHYIVLDFLCLYRSGDLRARSDAAKARWVNEFDIGRYELPKKTEKVIRKGFKMIDALSRHQNHFT